MRPLFALLIICSSFFFSAQSRNPHQKGRAYVSLEISVALVTSHNDWPESPLDLSSRMAYITCPLCPSSRLICWLKLKFDPTVTPSISNVSTRWIPVTMGEESIDLTGNEANVGEFTA